jgi:hypothetical protein
MSSDGQVHCSVPDIDVKGQSSKSDDAEANDVDKELEDPAASGTP